MGKPVECQYKVLHERHFQRILQFSGEGEKHARLGGEIVKMRFHRRQPADRSNPRLSIATVFTAAYA